MMTLSTHSWRYYLSPHEVWDAMYEDCRNAQQSIQLEQYILENDSVGQRFMELFIQKASEGLRVIIICDNFGSGTLHGSPLIKNLRAQGGKFYFFNVIYMWDVIRPWRWFPRTHIKTLLVDDTIAYTGSTCFAERMTHWRDTQIRITGPVVEQFRQAFKNIEEVVSRRKRPKRMAYVDTSADFAYLQSYPLLTWHVIYSALKKAIRAAEHSITITTPFFAPNRQFRRLLRRAAYKGIEVRLLFPDHSDVAMADWVCLSYMRAFLKTGVRIYRYKGMIHSKTVVIDDSWATVGSTNMDVLSFFRNRESNLVIREPAAISELKQQFANDLENSVELTIEQLDAEPKWKFAVGRVGRLIKSFLWRR